LSFVQTHFREESKFVAIHSQLSAGKIPVLFQNSYFCREAT
jgi:hypothetical protein